MQTLELTSNQLWINDCSNDSLSSLDASEDGSSCWIDLDDDEGDQEDVNVRTFNDIRRRKSYDDADPCREGTCGSSGRIRRSQSACTCEGRSSFKRRSGARTGNLLDECPMRKFRDETRDSSLSVSKSCHTQRLRHSQTFAKWNGSDSALSLRRSNPSFTSYGKAKEISDIDEDSFAGCDSKNKGDVAGKSGQSGVVSATSNRWTSASSSAQLSSSASIISVAATNVSQVSMKCPRRKRSSELHELQAAGSSHGNHTEDAPKSTAKVRPQFPSRRSSRRNTFCESSHKTSPGHQDTLANLMLASSSAHRHCHDSIVHELHRHEQSLAPIPATASTVTRPQSPQELKDAAVAATAAAIAILDNSVDDDLDGKIESDSTLDSLERTTIHLSPVDTLSTEKGQDGSTRHQPSNRASSLSESPAPEELVQVADSVMKKPRRRGSARDIE